MAMHWLMTTGYGRNGAGSWILGPGWDEAARSSAGWQGSWQDDDTEEDSSAKDSRRHHDIMTPTLHSGSLGIIARTDRTRRAARTISSSCPRTLRQSPPIAAPPRNPTIITRMKNDELKRLHEEAPPWRGVDAPCLQVPHDCL